MVWRSGLVVLFVASAMLVAGCAQGTESSPSGATDRKSSAPSDQTTLARKPSETTGLPQRPDQPPPMLLVKDGVFLPRLWPALTEYPEAMFVGKLVADENGCLRAKVTTMNPAGHVFVWPRDFGLETGGEDVSISNGNGRVVARVGEEVSMGGGEIEKETLLENKLLDKRTWRELVKRCPDRWYWLVGEGVHVPRQR